MPIREGDYKKLIFYEVKKKNLCRWYNETSAIKRAYDQGRINKKWVENYCWRGGDDCVRKKRFEEEGYVSPDYVLPDGSIDKNLKQVE